MSTEIRDRRDKNWFWVSRDVIQKDGKALGPFGIAVYAALCSHADDEQSSWPSIPTLADEIGCGERKVREVLGQLEKMGWIETRVRYREDGSQTSNIYYLSPSPHAGGGSRQDTGGVPVEYPHERESFNKNESETNLTVMTPAPTTLVAFWESEIKTPVPGGIFLEKLAYRIEEHGFPAVRDALLKAAHYGKAHRLEYVDRIIANSKTTTPSRDTGGLIAAIARDAGYE